MAVRVPRRIVILLSVLACAWAALVVAVPALARAGPAGARLAAVVYVAGGMVCHQRAERSFHLGGAQLPVCARCTALYLSGAVGLLAGLAVRVRRPGTARRAILLAACLPMVASVVLEAAGFWAASNAWRALSALPAGWAAGEAVVESSSFQGRLW